MVVTFRPEVTEMGHFQAVKRSGRLDTEAQGSRWTGPLGEGRPCLALG